jgi:hypothetical protein
MATSGGRHRGSGVRQCSVMARRNGVCGRMGGAKSANSGRGACGMNGSFLEKPPLYHRLEIRFHLFQTENSVNFPIFRQ